MRIFDRYIIVKYISTFTVMLMLFIPIGIMIDMAEKIDKFKENEVPTGAIVDYYYDFTWYFANLLFPVFLFYLGNYENINGLFRKYLSLTNG